MSAEFDLIERIRRRTSSGQTVALGIGDDAAVLSTTANQQLVAAVDTLVAGVHFDQRLSPADLGWKSVAVNLSDLAAMGAQPQWLLLALTMPNIDLEWVDSFIEGLMEICTAFDVNLVGGDTTRGPLTISVTALGQVPSATALTRSGAQADDHLLLTGNVGDAGMALHLADQGKSIPESLMSALARPWPQVAAGQALRGLAHACVDVSDGLVADIGHIATASGLAAEIDVDRLPLSSALLAAAAGQDDGQSNGEGNGEGDGQAAKLAWQVAATSGDDYQLCFAVPPSQLEQALEALAGVDCTVTEIGSFVSGSGGVSLIKDGKRLRSNHTGYEHFT